MSAERSNVVALPNRLPSYGDAHIAQGEYSAVFSGYETWARCHGWAPRVVLVFTIMEAGNLGVAIPGYYRVARLHGQPRRNGGFVIGTRSKLYRDLSRMLGHRAPTNCVPIEDIGNVLYTIVVRDTATDQEGHPLGGAAYSVVDWIKGRA